MSNVTDPVIKKAKQIASANAHVPDSVKEILIRKRNMKPSPDNITKLEANQIFVFGSNEGGRHGRGAAKQALSWGAVWGQAEGLQGRTYGIPTKDRSVRRVLSVEEIRPYVDRFIQFAKAHPELEFLVTEIGCGLSRMKPKQIAPLFKEALKLDNVRLPQRFLHKLI